MLDIESALELIKKYGYSSTSSHPYLYQSGDTIGLCYTYVDEDYGTLERIKIFDSLESFDEFLKKLEWLKKNGLNYHVRMCLDDYESINPKVLFLRNEKLMIEGEMEDIETFDFKEAQREQMDEPSKILYEAGDLLLIYDEIKNRQLQYLLKIIGLKNQLRQKYFDLQSAVDKYNKIKLEREIVKIPEVPDSGGIDLQQEIALKDRYNLYIKEVPPIQEVTAFLKEVWDLNYNLEMNTRYYDALREETEIRNEMKIVEKKLQLMEDLNNNVKPLFGVDLVSKFRKINRSLGSTINDVSKSIVEEKIAMIQDKYKYYANLDPLYVSDYLREAIQNSNYADLSIKYGKGASKEQAKKGRTPLNEIAIDLFIQFKTVLAVDEQSILVIYSNEKFRKICDAILAIPNFETFPPKQIIKKINNIKGFSKLKSECYISVRNRINDPINKPIKDGVFNGYDFTSFETFIGSLASNLAKLKRINHKMHLNGDINMYIPVKKVDDVNNREFLLVTNDINSLTLEAKNSKGFIGITLLKEGLPVLYSPFCLDLGDIYNKNASPKMEIKEVVNFEILLELSDVTINIDKNKTNVINYYSEIEVEGNISIVKDIKSFGKTTFIKYAFLPKDTVLPQPVQVEESTTPQTVPENMVNVSPEPVVEVNNPFVAPVENNPEPVTSPVVQEPVESVTSPEVQNTVDNPVAITSVNNGVDVNGFNQAYNNVLEQAAASGSMVAIASQEAREEVSQEPSISVDDYLNRDRINETVQQTIESSAIEESTIPEEVTIPKENELEESTVPEEVTILEETESEEPTIPVEVTTPEENELEEPTVPEEVSVPEETESEEPTVSEEVTTPEKTELEESTVPEEVTSPEKTESEEPTIPVEVTTSEENELEEPTVPEEVTSPEKTELEEPTIPEKSENEEPTVPEETEKEEATSPEDDKNNKTIDMYANKETEKIEESNVDEKNKDEKTSDLDLDQLLDTIATTMPKDLSKVLEDTNKMDLFADLDAENKQKEENEGSSLNKEAEKDENTLNKEEPKGETPKKSIGDNEPKKTQIVKKVITNPDGTKKVVMVKRVISTKKPAGEIITMPDGKKVRKVVRKIGQPVNAEAKKVIKKVTNEVPKEEK